MFPAFFVLPSMVDRWLVHGELNSLLAGGFLSRQILRGGTQLFVFVWAAVLLLVYLLCRKSLEYLLEYRELNV